jgi:glycosyltransferase involved in cell wall biosynthesis
LSALITRFGFDFSPQVAAVYEMHPIQNMKLVSVIIPLYGVEKYVAETVQSVLAQTYENFELLIVDDGSPDRSVEICSRFKDPRIQILRQENQGPAAARNLGIRHAKGNYIALLDGDDLWLPDKLMKHVEHLESEPEVGVSFCRSALVDEEGAPLGIYQLSKLHGITVLDLLCRTPIGNGSVPVMRREVFDAIQFDSPYEAGVSYFNPDRTIHPSEDVECWLRIALTTQWQIAGIPEALTLYRVNSGGCSAKLLKKLQSWEAMLAEVDTYAAGAMKPCKAAAMSYQYRHLAVTLRDGAVALNLVRRAIVTYPRILLEQPHRTVLTLGAALLLRVLPIRLYRQFEARALRAAGAAQKQQISKEAF